MFPSGGGPYEQLLTMPKLFMNLRNAAATFGTESKHYQSIHETVHLHLRQMQASGQKTDLTGAKVDQKEVLGLEAAFQKLDLDLKSKERDSDDSMKD